MGRRSRYVVAAVIVGLIAVAAVLLWKWPNGGSGRSTAEAEARLELARTALVATENLDAEQADQAWSKLHAQMPASDSVALNRALNRLLLVDALTESATNSLLSAEERQAARGKLPAAIEAARAAIEDYRASSDDAVTTLWLQSRIDLREASLLPAIMAKSLRRELFERLVAAINGEVGHKPGSIILGGPLVDVIDALEDPIEGLPADVQSQAATALETLSREHPDNLFIALRTARLGIAANVADAAQAVERTKSLAAAIEPMLRSQTQPIGLTPDELVQKILTAIEQQDWAQAENQMLLWFNVLNGTELVRTDRRRTSPHPLDRLSFAALRELSAEVAASHPASAQNAPLQFVSSEVASGEAWAVATPIDMDLDLDADVAAVSQQGAVSLWRNDGPERWTPSGKVDLMQHVAGILAVDLFMVDSSDPQRIQARPSTATGNSPAPSGARHTTIPTLVAYGDDGLRLISVDGRAETDDASRLTAVTATTGLEDVQQVGAVVAGDLEGDGDLDLVCATRDRGLRVLVNRGNRTFFEVAGAASESLADQRDVTAMAIVDLDRDLDLDIVTTHGASGRVGQIENLLHLQFRFSDLQAVGNVADAQRIFVGDLDGNVSWDLVVTGSEEVAVVYSQTADAGIWTVEQVERVPAPGSASVVADFDNDSWYELLVARGEAANVTQLVAQQTLAGTSVAVELSDASTSVSDFDLDGRTDLLAVADGTPMIHLNRTEPVGHYLDVRFKGIDDNNANSGRVNHYAIGSVLELRAGPHYRAQIITSPSTHFGIGEFDAAASLRVIFPNGLTQTIRDPEIDTLVQEEQTLKGSCPYLYAWNGTEYAFVTDCLWAAPLGLQVADGVVAKDRPWEYLKVDGRFLQPRDQHYDLRITEELWEVAYFDHVALSAVDHPADVQVWTNEKVGPAELATPTIHAFRAEELRPLRTAHDTRGEDVTEKLRQRDQDFAQGFDRRILQGLCPPHWVDLDFGALPKLSKEPAAVYLVITGWILPTDTSLNIQIDQNPELPAIEFPSVWVPDAGEPEGWRQAIPFMGFPGGKTKTIVVDVTEIIDLADARLRIRTSAQMYWDHAELAVQLEPAPYRAVDLKLTSAELGYHGFSEPVRSSSRVPESYTYSHARQSPKWPPLRGRFTSHGEALALLSSWDDSMVVMGSGDELRLRFTAPTAPLPEGWERDFVLHCVGWDKDADLNTLAGQSSHPLPFRAMQTYPPTLGQRAEIEDLMQRNAEHLQRTQSFRQFWSR